MRCATEQVYFDSSGSPFHSQDNAHVNNLNDHLCRPMHWPAALTMSTINPMWQCLSPNIVHHVNLSLPTTSTPMLSPMSTHRCLPCQPINLPLSAASTCQFLYPSLSTTSTSGKGHLALAVFRCFSCPRASWDILGYLGMSQDALGQLKHLKTARARWPFPDEPVIVNDIDLSTSTSNTCQTLAPYAHRFQ